MCGKHNSKKKRSADTQGPQTFYTYILAFLLIFTINNMNWLDGMESNTSYTNRSLSRRVVLAGVTDMFYEELKQIIGSVMEQGFWNIAVHNKRMALWSGMGRISDNLLTVLLAMLAPDQIDLFLEIIINLLITIIILVMIVINGRKHRYIAANNFGINTFRQKFNLTEREADVLLLLLNPDLGVEEMAGQLYISRRTLQRHIAAVYEKCGVNTRTGLFARVYQH